MRHRRLSGQTHGFTLIELSIVLVIIGLVAGGVLIGRELIESAKVRATISQLEQYSAAAHTFRTKYNCIPGDCARAVSFGLGTDTGGAGHNGNGDGSIPAVLLFVAHYAEIYNFWYHLQMAGLIVDNVAGYAYAGGAGSTLDKDGKLPYTKISHDSYVGATMFTYVPSSVAEAMGNSLFTTGSVNYLGVACTSVVCPGGFTAQQAHALDSKVDDGLPETGSVREWRSGGGGMYALNATTGTSMRGCHTSSNAYDIQGQFFNGSPDSDPSRLECGLVFSKGF